MNKFSRIVPLASPSPKLWLTCSQTFSTKMRVIPCVGSWKWYTPNLQALYRKKSVNRFRRLRKIRCHWNCGWCFFASLNVVKLAMVVVEARLGARQVVFLLPLHPPVLEPNFHLTLSQEQRLCDFNAPAACEVFVEVKLFLQFQDLLARVGGSRTFVFAGAEACWEEKERTFREEVRDWLLWKWLGWK